MCSNGGTVSLARTMSANEVPTVKTIIRIDALAVVFVIAVTMFKALRLLIWRALNV